jgi:hypothetical protein
MPQETGKCLQRVFDRRIRSRDAALAANGQAGNGGFLLQHSGQSESQVHPDRQSGTSYLVHRANDGAFDTLSDCASAALSGKCLLMKSAAHPGLET